MLHESLIQAATGRGGAGIYTALALQYQRISRAARMHFPAVILSEVGAHATAESKDPGAASCNDVDSRNFCDDPSPYHSRA
jgi:hypothetical protein